jgi:hypothetical protein
MDEGVHMDIVLQHLGKPLIMDIPQPTKQPLQEFMGFQVVQLDCHIHFD